MMFDKMVLDLSLVSFTFRKFFNAGKKAIEDSDVFEKAKEI